VTRGFVCGAVLAATLAGACSDVPTDPNAIVALAFDSLPYPAVVAFDTLRDEEGMARPLRAAVLNPDGNEIDGASVQFIALTEGVIITPDGFVVSTDARTTPVSIVAQVSGLQSRSLGLLVTPSPDSAARDGATDTLRYTVPDDASNVSETVRVKVWSRTATPAAAVRGWIVRYELSYNGATLVPNDTSIAWLVDDSNRRSAEDTTGTDGIAARKVRLKSTALAAERDSVIVTATVRARGAALAGVPIRVVIPIIPR
jgi:hypothetical protein